MQENGLSRVLAILLVLCMMVLSFTACSDKADPAPEATTKSDLTTEPKSSGDMTKGEDASDSTGSYTSGKSDGGKSTIKSSSGKTTIKSSGGGTNATTKSSGGSGGGGQQQPKTTQPKQTAAPTKPKSNTYYAPQVIYNSAPGTLVQTFTDGSAIDYSNTASGYVMVKYAGPHSNVRVQVTTPGGSKPLYPIFSRDWEALPLTNGNGTYSIALLANDGGTSYTVAGKLDVPVTLSYSTVAFYRPNIFCNYSGGTACVTYAAELTRGCDTEMAKIEAIYNYVVNNFRYDYGKASSVASSAYVPNLNSVWSSKSGICFDYASTMAAMLRTQGLPTKVCVGYANGSTYHAWISVYVTGSGWVNGIIQFNGNTWKLMDPTFASTGGNKYDWSTRGSYSAMYYY